jgi:hypothetical protein
MSAVSSGAHLRKLERDGLLVRTVYPTVPPKVQYSLTTIARELGDSFAVLTAWAERHRHAIAAARRKYDGQLGHLRLSRDHRRSLHLRLSLGCWLSVKPRLSLDFRLSRARHGWAWG